LFLRGGSDEQALVIENDTFQDHNHIDDGHNHADNGHSHSYSDRFPSYDGWGCGIEDGHIGPPSSDKDNDRYDCERTGYYTSSNNIGLQANFAGLKGADSSSRHGEETRPKNMGIVWIMRIW